MNTVAARAGPAVFMGPAFAGMTDRCQPKTLMLWSHLSLRGAQRRSDPATASASSSALDCFAPLAMTALRVGDDHQGPGPFEAAVEAQGEGLRIERGEAFVEHDEMGVLK